MKFCYILKINSQYEIAISFNLLILRNLRRLIFGETNFHGRVSDLGRFDVDVPEFDIMNISF
jgi:hypothetical protein